MTPEERRQLIETRKQATNRKERLWARDEWREFDIWQVPVEALLYNVDNRRFAAERTLIEEKLGHELDPENNPEDERAIEVILLDTAIDVDIDRVARMRLAATAAPRAPHVPGALSAVEIPTAGTTIPVAAKVSA